jgi:hypothetical protein
MAVAVRALGTQVLNRIKGLELPLRRYVLPDRFHRVEVETDSRCNRACSFCPVSVAPRPAHRMSEALFIDILDQLAEVGFRGRFSPHFYGEPLADPRLPALMAEVRARLPRAKVVIYTNGDLLGPERARALLDAGVALFIVTFEHGPSAAWRRAAPTLRPAERRRFLVRSFEEGVEQPFNRGGMMAFPGREYHQQACFAPASALVVDAWGKVRLCANDYQGEVEWGDLNTERIAAVWAKPAFVAERRALLEGKFTKPICLACTGRVPRG